MINGDLFVVKLADDFSTNIKHLGEKASKLNLLMQKEFNIPDGYVLTTPAYSLFLTTNNLKKVIDDALSEVDYNDFNSIEECSRKIRKAIKLSPLPSEVVNEVKFFLEKFPFKNLVIRSSATAEDLPTTSFAGQYDTFLNLKTIEQVLEHIRSCYASVWTSRAIAYRDKNNIPHDKVEIATIIQKMVPAKSAGVLFTANPVSLEKTEMVIESNFGLGESLVSGKISPDQFIIKRHGKSKNQSFKILTKRIGNKKYAAIPKSSEIEYGIEYSELSDREKEKPSISDKIILQLAKIGTRIEKLFGMVSQDIEWAIDNNDQIYILQTRPITSMKLKDKNQSLIFSRGYSDDYWNDNTTPLFFDLLGDHITKVVNMELNSIMGYKKIDDQLLKLYNGHVYFNLNVLKKKVEYEIPSFMRNEDVLNYFPDGSGPFGKETMLNLPFHPFKRIFAELRIMFHDPNGAMSKTAASYNSWTKDVFEPYCLNFDSKLQDLYATNDIFSLFSLAEELDKVMVSHFRLIRYGIPVHNIGMNLLTQYLLTRFLSKEESLKIFPILISGLEHKLTETNDQIHQLANHIQKSPELRELFQNKESNEIYNNLFTNQNTIYRDFIEKFKNFLQKYGDRGFTREPYYPRWGESPRLVFDILKSLAIEDWQELERIKAKSLQKKKIIEQYVESKIRSQKIGLLKWKFFSVILKNSRRYIKFRENQRFNLDKWITRNKQLFLEIGKKFVHKGIIIEKNDIFFLHKKEIKKIIFENFTETWISQIKTSIRSRKEEFFKYENLVPPKFLIGSQEFDDVFQFDYNSRSFSGIPASQGIITSPIRIVVDINLIPTVKAGEIIVVPRTDPGWTPIFSKIGGLITETGGILSHGAVVSREYGIPAVTNIPNACKLFKTGQIVTINGYNGLIKIN